MIFAFNLKPIHTHVLSEYGANEGDGALVLSAPLISVGVVDWVKGSVTPE